jgi:hypothetical protein
MHDCQLLALHRNRRAADSILPEGPYYSAVAFFAAAPGVSSIYIWSKNFSHSVNEKSEAKMAAIDVQ